MSAWITARFAREAVGFAGDAVVEPHPERDDQVGALHGFVRRFEPVHAEHPQEARVARRGGAERVDRRRVRQPEHRDEQPVEVDRAGAHAAADDGDGPPRGANPRDGVADRGIGHTRSRTSPRERFCRRGGDVEVGFEHVVGDVDEHRAGSPGARERERFGKRLGNIVHVW